MSNNLRIKRLNHTYMEEISMIIMEEVKDEELKDVIKKVVNGSKLDDPLFQGRSGAQLDRTSAFYIFKTICAELGVQDKYSVASWRKTFAYHYYLKYKDLSYLQWLFNQGTVNQALNFLGIEENMNLRFREGVSL